MKANAQVKKRSGGKGRLSSVAAKPAREKETRTGQLKPAASAAFVARSPENAFNVRSFCKRFDLIRPDLTRMTGYSQRAVDKWAAGEKPSPATQRRLREMERLFAALSEIMEPSYVGEWLKTPNEAFDGSTPLQVIERGETDRIWRMVFIVETGEPL